MSTPETILNEIVLDFLAPTVARLGQQLRRNICVDVLLRLDADVCHQSVLSKHEASFVSLNGFARVIASDTAIAGRYKYALQCIFDKDDALDGFSGIRMNGAVKIAERSSENDYSGFTYTYNEWGWGKKLREI